ncbi:helix-turn-helix domain-containing protein [candidate division KSB1 bacterium]|nr:helix-turn-helix domain-containing protein [candidate division KSB1 bacterium]
MAGEVKYFNSLDAANILGVNVSTIKRWTEEGKLECIKTAGGHRKFLMQHLADFLKNYKKDKSKVNLFPVEDDSDLEISYHILKRNCNHLINYIHEQALMGHREQVQKALNGMYLGQYPLYLIYDKIVTPILWKIGDMWESGEKTIIEEHFVTQTIRDAIVRLQGIIPVPGEKRGKAFCLIMSQELHDIALKMVDQILELKGFVVLNSGQMSPSLNIEKIYEKYHPDRVYISSTIVNDVNLVQAEFDKICYISEKYNSDVYIGGRGFESIQFQHSVVKHRFFSFEELYESL